MKLHPAILSCLLAGSICFAEAEGAPPVDQQVSREMICEVDTITAGQTFTVALRLKHNAPFHTYWRNPGLVGMPAKIIWALPPGFAAGAIRWPPPTRSKMLIYNTHGLEGDVSLLVSITAPDRIKADKVTLHARAHLMSCSEKVCCSVIEDEFTIQLPVADAPAFNAANQKIIAAARSRIPRRLAEWSGRALVNDGEIRLRLKNKSGKPGSTDGLYFFPKENLSNTEAEQVARIVGEFLQVTIPIAEYWAGEEARLAGVLYRDDGWSNGQKYMRINVPLLRPQ